MTTQALARPGRTAHVPPDAGRVARRDAAIRQVAAATLWLSLLLVTYWWVADGGIQDLGGWASALTSVGRLSGLVASLLLLAQVVLMSRVPALEAAFGQDRLARMHRIVGFLSFNLMLLHIGTVTWGYAGTDGSNVLAELWNLSVHYPGMLLAVAATVCLCMVVATSVRAARRRLRYESWHLLHLYAYVGVGLALPHQLWTGQEFLLSTVRTVFWWTAWALTAAAMIIWRVGIPVWRNLRHQMRVEAIVPEAGGIVSVYIAGRRLDRLPAGPGQFFSWRFLGGRGWTRANPYSLSAAPDGSTLRITAREVGDGSGRLRSLRPGSRVIIEGPYGRLSPRAGTRHRIAMIGAGVGMAPLRALAEGLPYRPGDAIVLHRFTDEPLFAEEFVELGRKRGLQVLFLAGRRRHPGSWLGDGVGRADDLAALTHWIPDIAERDVYVCGPPPWTELVRRTVLAAGLPPDQLHIENFAW